MTIYSPAFSLVAKIHPNIYKNRNLVICLINLKNKLSKHWVGEQALLRELFSRNIKNNSNSHFTAAHIHSNSQIQKYLYNLWGFLGGSVVKNLPAIQETCVRSLGQEDLPGEGNGSPLQHSCLENLMDRGAWQTAKSRAW